MLALPVRRYCVDPGGMLMMSWRTMAVVFTVDMFTVSENVRMRRPLFMFRPKPIRTGLVVSCTNTSTSLGETAREVFPK